MCTHVFIVFLYIKDSHGHVVVHCTYIDRNVQLLFRSTTYISMEMQCRYLSSEYIKRLKVPLLKLQPEVAATQDTNSEKWLWLLCFSVSK
uniref:Uncharacterized protein n=1 Tax=Zea mays TaxID=4577 RepID=A0A804PY40_MAIZE